MTTYLDNNATTALDSRVLELMLPYLGSRWGNPSSRHSLGRDARKAVDEARNQVAVAVGAHPTEVVFTSGGCEANNLFLFGLAQAAKLEGRTASFAVSTVEHSSVANSAQQLARLGHEVMEIPVDDQGLVLPENFASVMAQKPTAVSVMWANNETGVLQDIPAMAAMARQAGSWFHSDAVQALGKMAVNFRESGVHALSVSAHKVHGPKGAGALIVDKSVPLSALQHGGGQERALRNGTENVAAIVGFGLACQLATEGIEQRKSHIVELRGVLEQGLTDLGAHAFGTKAPRLPNTVFFSLPPIEGETLVDHLDRRGYGVATGSACSSHGGKKSATLLAMGVAPSLASCSVRVSLDASNTMDDVRGFLKALAEVYKKLNSFRAVA